MWEYTRKERMAIDKAHDAAAYLCEHFGMERRFRQETRKERRERSCLTTAKALMVGGFRDGVLHNPPASTLSSWSEGVVWAAIFGARANSASDLKESLEKFLALAEIARSAHDQYIHRGIKGCQ